MVAMSELHEKATICPYCGERITILVDDSVEHQQYIEDCEVCCRPMEIHVHISSGGTCTVEVRAENE